MPTVSMFVDFVCAVGMATLGAYVSFHSLKSVRARWIAFFGFVALSVLSAGKTIYDQNQLDALLNSVNSGVGAIAEQTKPPAPAAIVLIEKFPGQWPPHTNLEQLHLDENVKLSMKVGQTETTFAAVGGSRALSNIYLDICVPQSFVVKESVSWAPADKQAADPEAWKDCNVYSAYVPRVNDQQAIPPDHPLEYTATTASRVPFTFKWRVSAEETNGLVYGRFPVAVTP